MTSVPNRHDRRAHGAREVSWVSPPADVRIRYVLAIVFVAVAVGLRLLLLNHLGTRAVAITLFPAIILAALYGGRGPGLLAGLLSAVAIHFLWAEPIGRFSTGAPGDWLIVVFLMVSATAISFLAEAMQTALARASAAEAEVRLADERRTERAAADEARARLAAIVETSDDAIIAKNLDGIITNWNRGAERIFGYSASEIVGQPVLVLIPTERHNEEADILGHIRRGERVEHFETVRRRKDGTLFDVSLTVSPILDGEGKIIGASKIARDISARRQAEEKLRSSEALYRAIGESIPFGVWICEPDGRNIYASQSFLDLVGLTQEQCSSLGWSEVLHPDDAPQTIAAWQECVRTGGLWDREHRFRGVDGRWHHVLARGMPVKDGEGNVMQWTGINLDISHLKSAEAALRLSELRFRTAVSIVSSLIWTNNAEGKMEGMQTGWGKFTGQTIEEYQGYGWAKAVHPEDAQPTIDAWDQAVAEKKLFEFQHRVRRADGEWRLCSIHAAPVFGEGGAIVEWVGVHTDITDQKRSEESLRRSEERHRALITASSDVIYRMSADWSEMGPIDGRNLVPSSAGSSRTWLEDNFFPEDRPQILAAIEEAIRTKGVFTLEHRVCRADGTTGWTVSRAVPVCDERGEIVEWFGTASDVTERHSLEDALVARAEQLAQADRSKDEFLAMLAHELRNPLAPLRNAAELLKVEDASADDRTEVQRIISRQIENMSRMLDDLLDVSRITAGKIELRRKPVALEGILTAAASLVRSTCAAQKQKLAVSLPAEPIFLNADATRLEQIFGNLLNNASKYSGEGCHISISAERVRDAEPPEVVVKVRDDGAGIDPELLPRIFDLFVQASRTLDRAHGGLGIGLTLVQRLVILHGGSIEAHSKGHGHGAEFVVRLPILTQAPLPDPLPAAFSDQSSPGIKRRILIVDDNTDAARSLATLQQRRGHETRTAFTGPDAVAAAAEFLPDVVLLDIGLPGMDGFEVARKIRSIPALTGALLVAMSGYGREEDRAEAKLAGFNEYMVKPVDLDVLRDWLQNGHRP